MNKTTLPKKWYIKVTKENREILGRWRNYGRLYKESNGYCLGLYHEHKGYYVDNISLFSDFEEITDEEFKTLVLKIPPTIIETW